MAEVGILGLTGVLLRLGGAGGLFTGGLPWSAAVLPELLPSEDPVGDVVDVAECGGWAWGITFHRASYIAFPAFSVCVSGLHSSAFLDLCDIVPFPHVSV